MRLNIPVTITYIYIKPKISFHYSFVSNSNCQPRFYVFSTEERAGALSGAPSGKGLCIRLNPQMADSFLTSAPSPTPKKTKQNKNNQINKRKSCHVYATNKNYYKVRDLTYPLPPPRWCLSLTTQA